MIPSLLRPERLGGILLTAFRDWRGVFALAGYVFGHLMVLRRPPVTLVLRKQIYFTGIEAVGAIIVIALLTGIVIATQTTALVGHNPALLGQIMLWTVVRELGPVLTAIVIIARSSSAAASELASMKIRGEIASLRMMGIEPLDYLIVPRIIGVTLSVVAVTFYFLITSVLGGLAFNTLVHGAPFFENLLAIGELLGLREMLAAFAKSAAFGLMISATSCYFGLRAQGSVTAVPRAATGAVMRNLISLFLVDGLLTYLFFV